MLIRRQDISVLLLYYLGYSRIRNLILRIQRKPVAMFVAFHDLLPEDLEHFEANLLFLKQRTNVVGLDDFFSGSLSSEKINVVITFDDGYKSWVSNAIPILKKLGLPATFFLSSGFIGLSKDDEAEFMQSKLLIPNTRNRTTGGMSVKDVRRIVEEGFTIGGHTLNHCNMAKLRDSAQLKYEITEDKKKLERMAGIKIDYFAYPFGAYYNPEMNLTEVLRELGYKGAVTMQSCFNSSGSNPYLLNREITGASMSGPVFRARVYGNYEPVQFLKQIVRLSLQR